MLFWCHVNKWLFLLFCAGPEVRNGSILSLRPDSVLGSSRLVVPKRCLRLEEMSCTRAVAASGWEGAVCTRGQRNIPVCSARGCLISILLFTSQQPPCEGAFQLPGSPRSFCSEGLLFGDFTSSLPAAEMSLQCLVLFRGGKTTLLKTMWKKRSLKAERMRLPKMERKLLTNTFWFLSYPFYHPSSFVLLGFLSQDKHRVYFQFTVGRISIHFE